VRRLIEATLGGRDASLLLPRDRGGQPGRFNGGRVVWDAKQLQVCTPAPTPFHPIVTDRSKVTLDPESSPSGEQLAFVEAPDRRTGGWGTARTPT
jgi:hypothetical protein